MRPTVRPVRAGGRFLPQSLKRTGEPSRLETRAPDTTMNLDKIDLANLVAIGHTDATLGLLFDRGAEWEYVELPAPREAYFGLQRVAALASGAIPVLPARSLPAADCAAALDAAHLAWDYAAWAVQECEDEDDYGA
ncbi:MAG: hypothetical protein HC910_18175 [Spirulinaceae cyanobacterium SM2_1_0]|nr:hypothetical protein [Spirulinaceae cyanobacterium SM2_1_0]